MNKKLTAIMTASLLCASAMCVWEVSKAEKPQDFRPKMSESQPENFRPNPIESQKKKVICSTDIPLSPELQVFTRTQAEMNNVPYVLVLAVMEQESRFKLDADGGDSFGLMQINECHGPKEIIIEPHENIKIGCWLLGHLHREYRDWNKVLVAYNCGQAGAEEMYFRHGSISSPYSREVMFRSERFATLLGEESVLRPK